MSTWPRRKKEVDVGEHEAPAVARVALLLLWRRGGRAAFHVSLRRIKRGARRFVLKLIPQPAQEDARHLVIAGAVEAVPHLNALGSHVDEAQRPVRVAKVEEHQ